MEDQTNKDIDYILERMTFKDMIRLCSGEEILCADETLSIFPKILI